MGRSKSWWVPSAPRSMADGDEDNVMIARRGLLGAFLLLSACAASPKLEGEIAVSPPVPPKRVLFVCKFGSVKSPITRELAKRRAAERGLAVEFAARGITPEEHITPELASSLLADRIDPKAEPLQPLTAADVARADIVVVFDKLPALFVAKDVRDWSSLPSMISSYPAARVDLLARIDRLLDEVAGTPM